MSEGTVTIHPLTNNAATITMVSFPFSLKLTSTNYLSWTTQIEVILQGLDLYRFIDGSYPAPPPTVNPNGTTAPHADYNKWYRQDRLLFGALVGSLSAPIVSLVNKAPTSAVAWYFQTPVLPPLQLVDELATLGKPLDTEDVSDIILTGLDQKAYKSVIDSIHARDTPIQFHELHEKLVNHEISLAQQPAEQPNLHQPLTAFHAQSVKHPNHGFIETTATPNRVFYRPPPHNH
ncbi:hypothetical protein E3N88_12921 [Mikania micrantha]|uniref:Retrotransposon Copia-like N-terminal domain-containing protein n=1 Tax=Mikania micrantha TaxID=192012 RepID=A0A5N6P8P9_9ASTR|nr:hypothetical protein E3N88_12921 [Mikania micrantha]